MVCDQSKKKKKKPLHFWTLITNANANETILSWTQRPRLMVGSWNRPQESHTREVLWWRMLIIGMLIMRFFPNSLIYIVPMHAMEWASAPPADRHDGVAAATSSSSSSSTLMFMWAMESPGPSRSLPKALKSSDPLLRTRWVPICMLSYFHMRNPWPIRGGTTAGCKKVSRGDGTRLMIVTIIIITRSIYYTMKLHIPQTCQVRCPAFQVTPVGPLMHRLLKSSTPYDTNAPFPPDFS